MRKRIQIFTIIPRFFENDNCCSDKIYQREEKEEVDKSTRLCYKIDVDMSTFETKEKPEVPLRVVRLKFE